MGLRLGLGLGLGLRLGHQMKELETLKLRGVGAEGRPSARTSVEPGGGFVTYSLLTDRIFLTV